MSGPFKPARGFQRAKGERERQKKLDQRKRLATHEKRVEQRNRNRIAVTAEQFNMVIVGLMKKHHITRQEAINRLSDKYIIK